MGICAEVNFTYPSAAHTPPIKAPYPVYQKQRERMQKVFFLLSRKMNKPAKSVNLFVFKHLLVLIKEQIEEFFLNVSMKRGAGGG